MTLEKVSIESNFPIFKYGNRTFLIDDTLKDNTILFNILDILDNGFNFIPCCHSNFQSIIFNTIKNFDSKFYNFNANLFYSKNNSKSFSTSINKCKESQCISNRLNNIKSINNIPILKESLEFRFKFISELHEHLSNDKHKFNLKFHEILALKEFLRSKPFSIIEADKNVGACIISNELKDRLTLDSLNDSNTYLKLDYNPISNSISFINSELKKLNENKFLSNSFYKKLLVKDSAKLGAYRIMLKLHKSKFGIRPIVNCKNNITSKLCLFIDLLLKPLVRETESFLQDSQHLLQICEKIDLEAGDYYLYSCDFESLYTNIDLSLAMDLILDTLIENDIIDNNYNIFAVKTILNLIFTQNFFTYNGEHYSQVKGIAMGAICGPSIANIVVYKLEKSWLYIHKPLIYKRYIDDIFIVTKKPLNKIEFSKQFKRLKLRNVGNMDRYSLIKYKDKDNYEFKLIVKYIMFNKSNMLSFLNDEISTNSNFDKNYEFQKLIEYSYIPTNFSSIEKEEFINNFFVDFHIYKSRFIFYNYYETNTNFIYSNELFIYFKNEQLKKRFVVFPSSSHTISELTDLHTSYKFIFNKSNSSYNKPSFTLYSFLSLKETKNMNAEILKPNVSRIEFNRITSGSKKKINDLKLQIKNENIEIFLSQNFINCDIKCVYFTVSLKDYFNFNKDFKIISGEYNLNINIYYVKSYKNTVTYCLNIKDALKVSDLDTNFFEYTQVFSFTSNHRDISNLDYDENLSYFVKILPVKEIFYNKINLIGEEPKLIYSPSKLIFEVRIERVATELILFEMNNIKNYGLLYIRNSLFPVYFLDYTIEDAIKKSFKIENFLDFNIIELNFISFSYNSIKPGIANNNLFGHINSFIINEPGSLNYGKTRITKIISCDRSQIFMIIRTDFREFKNEQNSEIVFSMYETKAIFIINKFCFDNFINKNISILSYDGKKEDLPLSNNFFTINILNSKSITFNFEDSSGKIIISVNSIFNKETKNYKK